MSATDDPLPIYCWDSCVFLAWFKQESDKPLGDIALVVNEIDARKATLLLSVTTYEEVLDEEGSDAVRKFRDYLKRSTVETANVDMRVAEKVADIRNTAKAEGMNIKVPDAQIIATAIIYQADVLHSFDDKVLRFDRSPIVDGLKIVKPIPLSGQRGLFLSSDKCNGLTPFQMAVLFRCDSTSHARWGPPQSDLRLNALSGRSWV